MISINLLPLYFNEVKVILVWELMLKHTEYTSFKKTNFPWFDSKFKWCRLQCRVSTRPGKPGNSENVLDIFLPWNLSWKLPFSVLSWKFRGIFLLQFTIFLVIISVRIPSTLKNLENSLLSFILFGNLNLHFLCL